MDNKEDDQQDAQFGEDYNPEEDKVEGDFKKIDLPEVPKVTGEESEEQLGLFRSKCYRWRNKEWKERGTGDLKILQEKDSKRVRLLMRQDQTLKVIANFYIRQEQQLCKLIQNKTADNAWILDCYDFSEENPTADKLCFKFTNKEKFVAFQELFDKSIEINKQSFDNQKKAE